MFNDLSEVARCFKIICVKPISPIRQQSPPYVVSRKDRPTWSIPESCCDASVMGVLDEFGKVSQLTVTNVSDSVPANCDFVVSRRDW